jgi:Copper amine oxidase, enzyme domain
MNENGNEHDDLRIDVERVGRGPEAIDEVRRAALEHPSVRERLRGKRTRLLSVQLLEPTGRGKADEPEEPDRYRATIYDYDDNRVIQATGRLDDRESVEVSQAGYQPLPTREEFDEAVEILLEDEDLGPKIREQRLVPYAPMPPLIDAELPDGRVERTIAVGLMPQGDGARHEIVGANMVHRTVTRFPERAPETAMAAAALCGLPLASQPTAARGTPGQFRVTVNRGGTRLWSFLVVRPAASSGTNGSGVELRNVNYRGKSVLFRAHAPILNVRYDGDACGPFRDWSWQESMIEATGTDVAPGIRRSPTPAQTILESGTDTGNFLGVAIYRAGEETVVVSEMEAGWYRYISEWRLHEDGTIRPRFGFSAVRDSCVCDVHHHHVYWRLDFDIGTAENNAVREFNSPPIFPPENWHTPHFEVRRLRNPQRSRRWQVRNTQSGDAYNLIPGPEDGVADAFGRGDVWILRFHEGEIDDGVVAIGPPFAADIDRFVNGEDVSNQDVVVWYAAHFTHDVGEEDEHSHYVGPILRPAQW